MTRPSRWLTFVWLFAIAATGLAWFVLLHGFRESTEFGSVDSPLLAPLRTAHGLVALAGLALLGWIGGAHAWPQWCALRRRQSGAWLVFAAGSCAASGVWLLYESGERLRTWLSNGHVAAGALGVVLLVSHVVVRRAGRELS